MRRTLLPLSLALSLSVTSVACAPAFAASQTVPPVASPTSSASPAFVAHPMEEITLDSDINNDPEPYNNAPQANPGLPPASSLPNAPGTKASVKPLIITSTKIGTPLSHEGGSNTIITRQQILQMQAASISDVLRQVPGVDVVQSGSMGSTTSVFMRGANSEHTLIMIDGVRLNDPSTPSRSFNFLDQVNIDSIQQIEVLRGPQGALYGSDGLGGVINIITRNAEPGEHHLYAKVEGGSFGTINESLGGSAALSDKVRLFVDATRQDTRGFSSAGSRYGNTERDGYHNIAVNTRLQIQPVKNFGINLFSNFGYSRSDADNNGGAGGDDPNYTLKNRLWTVGGSTNLHLFHDRFEQITRVSLTDQKRGAFNDPDSLNPLNTERSAYRGKLLEIESINNIHLSQNNILTLGFDTQHEQGMSNYNTVSSFGPYTSFQTTRSATDFAFYAQDYWNIRNHAYLTSSIRYDKHNRFGNHVTYNTALNVPLNRFGTTLKGRFGTGFKAPSLNQLYSDPGIGGNPNLKAETSIGWDAGIEQKLFDQRFVLNGTVFQNQIKNLIQALSPDFVYDNVGKARTQGIELSATAQPFKGIKHLDSFRLRTSYTYTDTKNLDTGDSLLRRPRNKFSINANYQATKKLNLNVDVTHIGQSLDFGTPTIHLKAFTLVNIAATYDLTKNLNAYFRLQNAMDSPYEWVKGYGTPRISAYGGLRMSL